MRYGNYTITHNPKPIPTREHDYDYVHDDYDGPEDDRCGSAATLEACKEAIDELEVWEGFDKFRARQVGRLT